MSETMKDKLIHKPSGMELSCTFLHKTYDAISAVLAPGAQPNMFNRSEWSVEKGIELPTGTGAQIVVRDTKNSVTYRRFTLGANDEWLSMNGQWYTDDAMRQICQSKFVVVTYPGDPEEAS